jgi:hypothetical protein
VTGDRVGRHVERFNAAVRSGRWSDLTASCTDDAVLTFVGVPGGPYRGRNQITAAYASQPPDDTLTVREASTDGDVDTVAFDWDSGGGGTMRLRWQGDALAELTIAFDA